MSARPEWPVTFFDEDYLKIYRPQLTEERTRQEADFIETALGLEPGAAVLDLACGLGRHAIVMAGRGYRVTGVDFNPRYLELAGNEAARAGVQVRWNAGDMRALPFEREFDARVYTCAELTALLARHGMRVEEVWGGSDRSAYSTESRRLILLAERDAAAATGDHA